MLFARPLLREKRKDRWRNVRSSRSRPIDVRRGMGSSVVTPRDAPREKNRKRGKISLESGNCNASQSSEMGSSLFRNVCFASLKNACTLIPRKHFHLDHARSCSLRNKTARNVHEILVPLPLSLSSSFASRTEQYP